MNSPLEDKRYEHRINGKAHGLVKPTHLLPLSFDSNDTLNLFTICISLPYNVINTCLYMAKIQLITLGLSP